MIFYSLGMLGCYTTSLTMQSSSLFTPFTQEYFTEVTSSLEHPSVDNLNILSAFLLGLKLAQSVNIDTIQQQVEVLYAKKKGLKFIDRFTTISGSNHVTPETKEKLLTMEDPVAHLAKINKIAGKDEATDKILPFAPVFNDSSFQDSFLKYENEVFPIVVGALIERLTPVVQIMQKNVPMNSFSKKNTLQKLYQANNVGGQFISVDLRQANWTALCYWDSSLPSWKTFLAPLLSIEQDNPTSLQSNIQKLFLDSKIFRQITLGVALKKLGGIKLVEATQVMLIKEAGQAVSRIIGDVFSESNDEMIFRFRFRKGIIEDINAALRKTKVGKLCRLTQFYICSKSLDDCYDISYHELDTNKQYTLLRCATPEKVEARLQQ